MPRNNTKPRITVKDYLNRVATLQSKTFIIHPDGSTYYNDNGTLVPSKVYESMVDVPERLYVNYR